MYFNISTQATASSESVPYVLTVPQMWPQVAGAHELRLTRSDVDFSRRESDCSACVWSWGGTPGPASARPDPFHPWPDALRWKHLHSCMCWSHSSSVRSPVWWLHHIYLRYGTGISTGTHHSLFETDRTQVLMSAPPPGLGDHCIF